MAASRVADTGVAIGVGDTGAGGGLPAGVGGARFAPSGRTTNAAASDPSARDRYRRHRDIAG
jgi:hypothetical protein